MNEIGIRIYVTSSSSRLRNFCSSSTMADQPEQSSPVLQTILNSLSQSVDRPQCSVSELIDFLNSVLAQSDPDNEDAEATAFETLTQVHQFISSPSLDQVQFHQIHHLFQILILIFYDLMFTNCLLIIQGIIDQLSFELPKAVAEFGGVSDRCLEVAESIIDRFVSMCGARDMLSVLGEVCYLYCF